MNLTEKAWLQQGDARDSRQLEVGGNLPETMESGAGLFSMWELQRSSYQQRSEFGLQKHTEKNTNNPVGARGKSSLLGFAVERINQDGGSQPCLIQI